MNWSDVPKKWLLELSKERQFSEETVKQTTDLLTRLERIVVDKLDIAVPSIENEPVPIELAARQSVPAITWVAPGERMVQFLYLDIPKRIELRRWIEDEVRVNENPDDEQMKDALLWIGVRPIEGEDNDTVKHSE